MTLAYRGEPYHGWQVQPGQETVQGVIEQALSTLLRKPTPIDKPGAQTPVSTPTAWWHISIPTRG